MDKLFEDSGKTGAGKLRATRNGTNGSDGALSQQRSNRCLECSSLEAASKQSSIVTALSLFLVSDTANADILNPAYGEVGALLEAGVQLIYLGVLLILLGVGSFLVVRQVLIKRELETAAIDLQERLRTGDASSLEYFELGAVMLRKKYYQLANKYLDQAQNRILHSLGMLLLGTTWPTPPAEMSSVLSSVSCRLWGVRSIEFLQIRNSGKDCQKFMRRSAAPVAADNGDEEKGGWYRVQAKKDGGRWRAGRYATSITFQVDSFKLDQDIEKLLRKESRLLPEALVDALNKRIRAGEVEKAMKIFELLRGQEWYVPQPAQYLSLLKMLAERRQFIHASKLWTALETDKLPPSVEICTALLNVYVKCGRLDAACELFERMKSIPDCSPDVYTYTVLMEGFLQVNEEMGASPGIVTFNTLIRAYGRNQEFMKMRNVAQNMLSIYFQWDEVTFNTMIEAYGRARMIEDMEEIYRIMKCKGVKPTPFTLTTLINAYAREKMFDKVEKIRREWMNSDIRPDVIMYNSLLEAYRRFGNLSLLEEAFSELENSELEPSENSYVILANAYRSNGLREKYNEVMAKLSQFPNRSNPSKNEGFGLGRRISR
ncbi:hypothetical protein R1sor_009399 [Riccia sorocarpa]|uniref:Pentatricopeptide repeat-containing protein n=1 Tax=Riccia sorocarpa TaxID=122646 RepID=A0ABD3HV50_9MARC